MTIPPIQVDVRTEYLDRQSDPGENRYAFAYHISISNKGEKTAQLLSRHWIITDGNQSQQEVHGMGVVGEQPYIQAGETYQYTSGIVLETPIGTMQGSYQLIDESGLAFDAPIAPFLLAIPNAVH